MVSFYLVWTRIIQLLEMPKHNPEALWTLSLLFLTIIFAEFYFGRYVQERVGWNTAVINNLVLLFISIDVLKYLFLVDPILVVQFEVRFTLAIVLGIISIFLIVLEFLHVVSERFAFVVSSHLPINLSAFFVVILVYSHAVIDFATIIAVMLLMLAIILLAKYVHFIAPKFIDIEVVKKGRLENRLRDITEDPVREDEPGILKNAEVIPVGKGRAVVEAPYEWKGGEVNMVLAKEPEFEKKRKIKKKAFV